MIRGVGRGLAAALGALALAGCAGARVDLAGGSVPRLPRPEAPMPARLTVMPIEDARDAEDREGRTGLFLQGVSDARFNADVAGTVSALLRRRLAEAGLFAEVRGTGAEEDAAPALVDPTDQPGLLLRGRLVTLSGERDAQLTPIVSLVTLPLAIPLAIAGAVRSVPTPIGALVPVTYSGQAVLEVEVLDAETDAVLWRREVSGVAREEVAGLRDLLSDRGQRMAEAAREALGQAVTQLVHALAFEVARSPASSGISAWAALLHR